MQRIREIDGQFAALFDKGDDEDGEISEGGKGHIEQFNKYYGWLYQTVIVAEHERITLDQAYELPIMQYLNDLVYIGAKRQLDEALRGK